MEIIHQAIMEKGDVPIHQLPDHSLRKSHRKRISMAVSLPIDITMGMKCPMLHAA
jgi:hypothetical protein